MFCAVQSLFQLLWKIVKAVMSQFCQRNKIVRQIGGSKGHIVNSILCVFGCFFVNGNSDNGNNMNYSTT